MDEIAPKLERYMPDYTTPLRKHQLGAKQPRASGNEDMMSVKHLVETLEHTYKLAVWLSLDS